jgi:hypothetical protein
MSEKPLQGEILEPAHEYDNPELTSKDFLRAIRNDRRVPLSVRMEAAKAEAVYEHPRLAQVSQDVNAGITIRIEGGLPDLPGTNVIMPGAANSIPKPKSTNGSGS